MNHVIVVTNTSGLPAPQLMAYGSQVLQAMTNNSNFQDPFPPLSDLQLAIDELDAAITDSVGGGKAATAILHDKEYNLLRILKAMTGYVEYISNDDESMALSSGFSVRQQVVRNASGFKAKNGINNGEVLLKTKAVRNASYIWQYTADLTGAGGWITSATTTQAGYTVTGLTSLQKYLFRVAIVNSNGQQPFGDAVMLLVL